MSISDYITAIKTVLSGAGYREVPENKTVDETTLSFNDKTYSLKWVGSRDLTYLTSNKIIYNGVYELIVRYKNIDSSERTLNADNLIALITSLSEVTGFMGFAEEINYEDIDNKHSKGTIKLIYGAETNC